MTVPDIQKALTNAQTALMRERTNRGTWEGELSSSALATAIAVFALAQADRRRHGAVIDRGLEWIAGHANSDGGWGDSPDSPTNITATVLCWSALSVAEGSNSAVAQAVRNAERWLLREAGGLDPDRISTAIIERYGNDRTFAGPILTMCALAGRLGPADEAWGRVPQLPFELILFPNRLFKWLKITVVSYALPALIAIGLVRHRHRPSASPILRTVRDRIIGRGLAIAERMQPPNGGYEEATPLTAFVTMSLVGAGYREHRIVERAVGFLVKSMRPDGSWPIDTNLATWVTTLSVNALHEHPSGAERLSAQDRATIRDWLLAQQYDAEHPLTFGAPGGWAWTDLPGGMPDADDTPGVLLALRKLGPADGTARAAAARGIRWLLDLQNSDGGIPTFSRGWGRLPFDRSCADLTAHAIRAFDAWYDEMDANLKARIDDALESCMEYLARSQSGTGAWVPLWFGNQYTPGQANPVYGTAQVVIALRDITSGRLPPSDTIVEKGCRWLVGVQNADGGWGGDRGCPSSVEETALAVRALAGTRYSEAGSAGLGWLVNRTAGGTQFSPSPIGLYFAKLWYSEKMYPIVFTVAALGASAGSLSVADAGCCSAGNPS